LLRHPFITSLYDGSLYSLEGNETAIQAVHYYTDYIIEKSMWTHMRQQEQGKALADHSFDGIEKASLALWTRQIW